MINNYFFRHNTRTGRYFISQILLEETIVTSVENVNACFRVNACLCSIYIYIHSVFFCNTSNFGAEPELSSIFLRFELKALLRLFLNYMVCIIYVNQCGHDFDRV